MSLLPLALLPQVLLSREAAGDGPRPWWFLPPYAPLAVLPEVWQKLSPARRGLAKMVKLLHSIVVGMEVLL
ncbi:MAG: hypothetical protein ACP5I8_00980 [Phycisphaerae bacterium]